MTPTLRIEPNATLRRTARVGRTKRRSNGCTEKKLNESSNTSAAPPAVQQHPAALVFPTLQNEPTSQASQPPVKAAASTSTAPLTSVGVPRPRTPAPAPAPTPPITLVPFSGPANAIGLEDRASLSEFSWLLRPSNLIGAIDLRNIFYLQNLPLLGMQLISEIPDAAPGKTTADLTLSGSWGTRSAQSQLQALAGGTSFGRYWLTHSRLQHHGALYDEKTY